MNNQQQQQQPKKEPVPLGPSQELESLLPRKHEKHHRASAGGRHCYCLSSSRRTIVPLVVLTILASLTLFHGHSSWTVSETARPAVVQETTTATTDSTKATEPVSIIQTNVADTASTIESPAQTITNATTLPISITQKVVTTAAGDADIDGRTRFFTSYQVSWGAFHPCSFPYCMTSTSATSGCLWGAGPSIRIYCGTDGKLDYISQSNCVLDQHGSSSHSLYCHGSQDNFVDTVYVTCSGINDNALQIDVQLEGRAYRCNQVLSEHYTWNAKVQEKGGSVGQRVVVATRSSESAAWSEITSASRTAVCSTGVQCLDTYVSCRGPDACEATVPYLVATADLDEVVAAALAAPGATGDACTMDYTCQSGKCDDGVCRGGQE